MAKYKVIQKSFIGGTIIDPEVMSESECIIEYDGKAGSNLELIEDEKPKRSRQPVQED